jgi:hypothetical protein
MPVEFESRDPIFGDNYGSWRMHWITKPSTGMWVS